ncbi:hypothetical protein KR222_010689, partial [Zaprionus bogoriensis]
VFLIFGLLCVLQVKARFCEGGHICSLPRECCTQGCCPPYQGGPRQLPQPSEHVLNLFFISHWFFWCLVVAIILAILCAYSLWKKRRTLCGWGFTEHHTQSEGDSAGSCYAPPQYSRCNSFHHPPPPYTEVTSKPDLYPLVFTGNNDNSKGNAGSSYLMVQYFRNYIVRPAGSLSAASTVDSLSSSFICNAEANTLVPPPYSRATSPELSLHYGAHREPPLTSQLPITTTTTMQYGLPRSASQLVEPRQTLQAHYATVAMSNGIGGRSGDGGAGGGSGYYSTSLHSSHSGQFSQDESVRIGSRDDGADGSFVQSQSDQNFRCIANSSCSLSDIFVSNSCGTGLPAEADGCAVEGTASGTATQAASLCSLAMVAPAGTSNIYSNGCIQPNPLHSLDTCCQLAASGDAPTSALTTASTVSGVSSLSNIDTPSSPPQATSPTSEMREILNQIRQLQAGVSYEQLLLTGSAKPRMQHTLATPMTRLSRLQHKHLSHHFAYASTSTSTSVSAAASATAGNASAHNKIKKLYACKPPNKALYIPMAAIATPPAAQRCVLKSPASCVVSGASFFVNRGRVARKDWISRSAPTTPGSGLPPNRLGDDSPLLNEDDEDAIEE